MPKSLSGGESEEIYLDIFHICAGRNLTISDGCHQPDPHGSQGAQVLLFTAFGRARMDNFSPDRQHKRTSIVSHTVVYGPYGFNIAITIISGAVSPVSNLGQGY